MVTHNPTDNKRGVSAKIYDLPRTTKGTVPPEAKLMNKNKLEYYNVDESMLSTNLLAKPQQSSARIRQMT